MRLGMILAIAAMFAGASHAIAASSSKTHVYYGPGHGSYVGRLGPGHVYAHRGVSRGHGYAALVGDPGGGLGFYPLPYQYRVGAWRYHMRTWRPEENPVIQAAQDQAIRYYGWGDPTPADSYRYGVYNPIEGVGSPFFAGYYGPAGDEDDDSSFPFGRPYGP